MNWNFRPYLSFVTFQESFKAGLRRFRALVRGAPSFHVESAPELSKGSPRLLNFSGWCFDPRSSVVVELWNNETLIAMGLPTIERPDVRRFYLLAKDAPPVGFFLSADWRDVVAGRSETDEILLRFRYGKNLSVVAWLARRIGGAWRVLPPEGAYSIGNPIEKSVLPASDSSAFAMEPLHPKKCAAVEDENLSDSPLESGEIVFLVPEITPSGGVQSVLQHAREFRKRGIPSRVIPSRLPIHRAGRRVLSRFGISGPEDLQGRFRWTNQIIIATYWKTAFEVHNLRERFPQLRVFYYVQDYEPWFYPEGNPERANCQQSYHLGLPMFAKTEFLREILQSVEGVRIGAVLPGIDTEIFYPEEQTEVASTGRPIRIAAMLRPSTPRRGAAEMLELLARLSVRGVPFQCDLFGEAVVLPRSLATSVTLHGTQTPYGVAELYRKADVVLDLSSWQGFGRIGIESMACGAIPIMFRAAGGVGTYARHGYNSFLIESLAEGEELLGALATNPNRLVSMRTDAVKTASRFAERLAADSLFRVLSDSQLESSGYRRAQDEGPQIGSSLTVTPRKAEERQS